MRRSSRGVSKASSVARRICRRCTSRSTGPTAQA
jgi:hypothetical protein